MVPIYGIVDQPYIGERFEGGFGRAEVNGPQGRSALRTRGTGPLSDAILFTHLPRSGHITGRRRPSGAVAEKVKLTRYGMDCYAYALLAAGQIDLVIESGLNAL